MHEYAVNNPDREPEPGTLHERTDRLNQRIEKLEKRAAMLADRLEPVLRPAGPVGVTEQRPDRTDSGSWLADYLDATGRRLDEIADELERLVMRVDL